MSRDLRPKAERKLPSNLKLMADYDCWCLWDTDEPDNINPDSLPLSEELKQDLHKWSLEFDQILKRSDPKLSKWPNQTAQLRFNLEGRRLWQCLIRELPECKISYFEERTGTVLRQASD